MDAYAVLAWLKEAYNGDAVFRPSSIGRTIACKGSAQLIARAGRRRRSSVYALEGSAAHVLAEQALKGIRQPHEWTDRKVKLFEGTWTVESDMAELVQGYVDRVRADVTEGVELLVEHRMSLGALDPRNPVMAENRGTADALLLDRRRRRIKLKDLKFGRGVDVKADSPQVKDYAVLAVLSFPDTSWDEVELVIDQPRAGREEDQYKSVSFSVPDLLTDFLGELMEAMHDSLRPDPPLKTGPHCRWCPAKDAGICPALQSEALGIARDALAVLPPASASTSLGPIPTAVHLATPDQPSAESAGATILPPASSMSPADIATVLDRRHLWDLWIQSVEQRACDYIEAGVTVRAPGAEVGWMLSARTGHRRWIGDDDHATAEALRGLGLRTGDMYEPPKLLSPAKVEKKLAKERRHEMAALVERPKGAPALMRAKPDREPIGGGMGPVYMGPVTP